MAAPIPPLTRSLKREDIVPWDDFINRIRGENVEPKFISGRATWQGRMTGPLNGPTFAGHVSATEARYDTIYWDSIEGDLIYEPDGFRFLRGNAQRGPSSAQFEVSIDLDDWHFDPDTTWNFDATLVRTDTDGLQAVLGWSYPAHGMLSGNFRGGGTRANPEMNGLFDIIEPRAWGWQFDRARGEITLRQGEVRISNAELRLPPPALGDSATPVTPGLLTGNFLYRTEDAQVSFDITGAVVPLAGIQGIQAPSLPVRGQLSFHLTGEGPVKAPRVDGTLRLVNLQFGDDLLGSFQGRLNSDGARMSLDVDSEISTGEVHGHAEAVLSGNYPVTAQVSLRQVDIDPFITAGLRLQGLTGHSSIDGNVTLSGSLLDLDALEWDVDLSRISVSYASVNLENSGPVRLQYRRDEVRVQPATLRGPETDFTISGSAHFNGARRALDLRLAGEVNLRLLSAFVAAAGRAGRRARGRRHCRHAFRARASPAACASKDSSVRYGDFPAGLSNITGDLVFDASRLVFDNLTAESGGGQLNVNGSLTYGNGPVRYDLTARSTRVRIRYPVGMSWLAGGTLRLTGDSEAATLSGRVTVERLLMAEGFDLGSLVASSVDSVSAPSTTSPFLRNLQFDIQADLAPNARLEWASALFQTEASMRVRGTWEHPILLGHLHLLNGEMQFRGNRYQLSRGDINFANPFRLDPVISIEAATTIRQYEVTVNFTGPASHLTMSYRSDPPLPSSDIIALLALGQTGEESRLARPARPDFAKRRHHAAFRSHLLPARRTHPAPVRHQPFQRRPIPEQHHLGRHILRPRHHLPADFSRTWSSPTSPTSPPPQQQVIQVEYAVRRDISVVALRDENGTFGVDIIFKKRFK